MTTKNKGTLFVVSGPAGAGKGTICKEFMAKNKSAFLSVSATTRSPRPGEEHGKSYYFVSKEEFETMIANDGLLEYATFCDNYYGTPKAAVEQRLENGDDIILEIEVQGAMQIKKKLPHAVLVFIIPPTFEILRQRLIDRGTETPDVVEKRLTRAKEELLLVDNYDYIVVNDTIEQATEDFCNIAKAEKNKTTNILHIIREAYNL